MNKLQVGDFVKLTGTTLKTVNYYHKLGLLPEPERTAGGYRLYGPAELNRMRLIRRLKSLGLDLQQIGAMLGDANDPSSSPEVLQALRRELLNEIEILQGRVAKIDALLGAHASVLDQDVFDPPSLQLTTQILGADEIENYAQVYPEIYAEHRKLHGILDDFQWGEDYRQTLRELASFFKEHPQEYRTAMDYAGRLRRISHLSEDDPEIDILAQDAARLIQSMPILEQVLFRSKPMQEPWEGVYEEMITDVLSPARIRFNKLLQKYLQLERKAASD